MSCGIIKRRDNHTSSIQNRILSNNWVGHFNWTHEIKPSRQVRGVLFTSFLNKAVAFLESTTLFSLLYHGPYTRRLTTRIVSPNTGVHVSHVPPRTDHWRVKPPNHPRRWSSRWLPLRSDHGKKKKITRWQIAIARTNLNKLIILGGCRAHLAILDLDSKVWGDRQTDTQTDQHALQTAW